MNHTVTIPKDLQKILNHNDFPEQTIQQKKKGNKIQMTLTGKNSKKIQQHTTSIQQAEKIYTKMRKFL